VIAGYTLRNEAILLVISPPFPMTVDYQWFY